MTNGNIFVLAFNVAIVVFVSPWWLLATIPVTIGYFALYSQEDGEKMKQMLTALTIINLITILLPFPFWIWLIDLVVSVIIASHYEPKEDNNTDATYHNYDMQNSVSNGYSSSNVNGTRNQNGNFGTSYVPRYTGTNDINTNTRQQNYPLYATGNSTQSQFWNQVKDQFVDDMKDEAKDWAKDKATDWAKSELKERTGVDLDADDFGYAEVRRRYNEKYGKYYNHSNDNHSQNGNGYASHSNNGYGNNHSSYSGYNTNSSGNYGGSNYSSNNDYNSGGGHYASNDDYSSFDDLDA